MDHLLRFLGFDGLQGLVQWGGYIGLAVIIFAETGVLAGFFLPGDSLLVTAGLFAAPGGVEPLTHGPLFNILYLNLLLIPMAIIGDAVGYWFGKTTGSKLYEREDSRWFKKKHLVATQDFYNRHGGKTIVIARFMPFARTFAPVIAGVAGMPYSRFALFNIAGAIGWITSMTLLGYFLGQSPLGKHIELIILIVVFVSISPALIAFGQAWLANRKKAS